MDKIGKGKAKNNQDYCTPEIDIFIMYEYICD